MAVAKKKPVRKVRFELTWRAIAGIAVVVFCLFLWMFLLGVWAGQSLLLPTYIKNGSNIVENTPSLGTIFKKVDKKLEKPKGRED
jgi:hypothetical protein